MDEAVGEQLRLAMNAPTRPEAKGVSDEARRTLQRELSADVERIFGSYMLFSLLIGGAALYGCVPPDPAVHWPGHAWIHFMKREIGRAHV